jgi:hypothetical protein
MRDFFKISLTLWGSDKFNALPSDAKLCFVYCLTRLMRPAEVKGPGSERGRSLPGPRVTEWDCYSVPACRAKQGSCRANVLPAVTARQQEQRAKAYSRPRRRMPSLVIYRSWLGSDC